MSEYRKKTVTHDKSKKLHCIVDMLTCFTALDS